MSLDAGSKLSTYEILELIGAGGMGEVYRAYDGKLGRDVAIKVLPEAFAHDSQRLARFQREAKILAALNHPGIAAIYGLEEDAGRNYLVMELVPGKTLQERIAREGPMAVEEALDICRQIAEALEAAHEKGIIHRDLKPANVKVTPEGKVKVLDFGLAKAFAEEASDTGSSQSPTLSAMATAQGVILGTAAYMSPEQARARTVDKRTDLWAFGCVLYELLTGKQAFRGESITDILAAVLRADPDWQLLPAATPLKIRELLRRCLQKDLRRRLHDAADARIEIEEALAAPSVEAPAVAASRFPWKIPAVLLLGLILGATIAGVALWNLRSSMPAKVTRFSFVLPQDQSFNFADREFLAISPDGESFAYRANDQGYLKRLSETESLPILGNVSNSLCFSPDGQWVAFYSFEESALKKIAVTGGAAVPLCKASNPYGISWQGDTIVFGQRSQGILAVSANGGTPEVWVQLEPGEVAHDPELLPDGNAVLFAVLKSAPVEGVSSGANAWDKADICVYSRKTGKRTRLLQGGSAPRYAPTGHLIYALGTNLLMVPVDLKRLTLTGGSAPILQNVLRYGSTGAAHFAFSPNGTLVYVPTSSASRDADARVVIALADRGGKRDTLGLPPGSFRRPRISADGKQLAVETRDEGGTIWIYNLFGTSALRQLTFEGSNSHPVWSPDGRQLAFLSNRDNKPGIFLQSADGTGAAERLATLPAADSLRPGSWSPDGKNLAFMASKTGDLGIWTVALTGERKAELFMDVPGSTQADPTFSPDGRWIAYVSNESSGGAQIYVKPFPKAGDARYQISREGSNIAPVWSRDGKTLFYYNLSRPSLMAVSIQAQPALPFGQPVPVPIEGMIQAMGNAPDYDVMPDGKRFVVILSEAQRKEQSRPTQQIDVVLNWFEDLKQRTK